MIVDANAIIVKIKKFSREFLKSDDVVVITTKTPKSVLHFLPEEENRDIIFVYKHKTAEVNNHCPDYKQPSINESYDGNPLEAPFHDDTVNISGLIQIESDNNTISPIPIQSARAILSHCNLEIEPSIPIWCFCDDENESNKTVFLSTLHNEGFNIRCMASSLNFDYDFKLDILVKRHKDVLNATKIKKSLLTSIYNIHTEYSCGENDKLRLAILIKLSWSKLMQDPPIISDLITSEIIAKVLIGQSENGLSFFWNELLILNEVLKMIKTKELNQFGGRIEPFVMEIDGLRHQINDPPIVKSSFFNWTVLPEGGQKILYDLLDDFMSSKSTYLDSTDILWFWLLKCKSVDEISSRIQEVADFKCSNKFRIVHGNISRVSLALSGKGSLVLSDIAEHFVEVGIEKLRKEIINIFTQCGISANFLKIPEYPNFSELKNVWIEKAEGWLVWISQTYCALEILANTQKILNLGNSSMEPLIKKVLKKTTSPDLNIKGVDSILKNPYQEFILDVPSEVISSHLKRDNDVWMVGLESETHGGSNYCKSIFTKSVQSPFPQEINLNEMTFNLNTSTAFEKTADLSIIGNIDNSKETFWSEMLVLKNEL